MLGVQRRATHLKTRHAPEDALPLDHDAVTDRRCQVVVEVDDVRSCGGLKAATAYCNRFIRGEQQTAKLGYFFVRLNTQTHSPFDVTKPEIFSKLMPYILKHWQNITKIEI